MPVLLNGPTIIFVVYFQYSWVGPLTYQTVLPIILAGPSIFYGSASNAYGWAQQFLDRTFQSLYAGSLIS